MELAPICLFTYNRLVETKQTIEALQLNYLAKESDLFIFSDGWKIDKDKNEILEVRAFLKTIFGFKNVTVFENGVNKGLANSIISGVSQIISEYGKVIVLEDDLITTPNFLDFMNQSLSFYESSETIQSISGYSLAINNKSKDTDVYFHNRAHSWSWATWKNSWHTDIFDKVAIDNILNEDILNSFKKNCGEDIAQMLLNSISGKNDSWYVRWAFNHFMNKTFTVYPYFSKTENIGFSAEGTNCNDIDVFKCEKDLSLNKKFRFINFREEPTIKAEYLVYWSKLHKLKFRLMLMKTEKGRKKVFSEIKRRFL